METGKNPMGSATKENSALSGFSGHNKPAFGGMNFTKRNSNDMGERASRGFCFTFINQD